MTAQRSPCLVLAFVCQRRSFEGMSAPLKTRLATIWQNIPFREMTLLVLALFIIKEQFPFSNFPMYSNIDDKADVVFVADQNDKPLPMKALFKTSSGSSKKMLNTEIKKLANPHGRDSADATPEEVRAAGKAVLDTLMTRLRREAVPPETTTLRFYRKTFRAGELGVGKETPELLAEVTP